MRHGSIGQVVITGLNIVGLGVFLLAFLVDVGSSNTALPPGTNIDFAALPKLDPSLQRATPDLTRLMATPIFHQGRSAYKPPPAVKAPAAPRKIRLELAGITSGGNGQWAYIKDMDKAETRRLAVGDVVQGWTIGRIEDDLVKLEQGADVIFLRAVDNKTGSAARPSGRRTRRDNRPRTRNENK